MIGRDCEEKTKADDTVKIEFPMKTLTLRFPCIDTFDQPPLVVFSIMGEDTSKVYASSLRNVTARGFAINVQRVDDVPHPDMNCNVMRVSYIATTDFVSDDDEVI